eukprot:7129205-Pyramimonas_sp.AAC.1
MEHRAGSGQVGCVLDALSVAEKKSRGEKVKITECTKVWATCWHPGQGAIMFYGPSFDRSPPRWPPDGPRGPQRCPKTAPRGAQEVPKMPQEAPERPLRDL